MRHTRRAPRRPQRALEWSLAEARRRHVKDQITAADLPVKHEVWKFGSPHMLVLTKTGELFQPEANARKDAAAILEWLAAAPGRGPHGHASVQEHLLIQFAARCPNDQ